MVYDPTSIDPKLRQVIIDYNLEFLNNDELAEVLVSEGFDAGLVPEMRERLVNGDW